MRNRPAALVVILLSYAVACAAQSPLIRFAPSDSGVIIGLNLQQMKASSIGQSIFSEVQAKMGAEMQKLIQTTGFDPLRDIDEALIAAPGRNQKSRGVFLLRGTFDPTRFAELAVLPGMTASTFRGVRILTKKDDPMAVACLDSSLVVGGDAASVRGVIANRDQDAGPDAALAAKAAELSAANDIWLVTRTPPAEFTGDAAAGTIGGNPQMEMLRSIEQASGGVKFGTNLLLTADVTTRTPKDAQNIAATLRLIIGLSASSQRDAKQAAAILEKLALRADANTVKMSFSIPEAEIKKSMESAMAAARQRAATAAAERRAEAAPPKPTGVTIYSSPRDMGVVTLPPPK